jgi:hypothetical protein
MQFENDTVEQHRKGITKCEQMRIWNKADFASPKVLSGIHPEKMRATAKSVSQSEFLVDR